MGLIDKFCALLSSQIKQPSAKLPTKEVNAHTIQDNDQSIKLGAINEKSTPTVRSKTATGKPVKRVSRAKR